MDTMIQISESIKAKISKDPRTYARTVYRMPKMERLIEIIYRVNPQLKDSVNEEARRFVFPKAWR